MGYTLADIGLAEHDGKALILEPGKTYVVEMLHAFPHDGLLHLKQHLEAEHERTGVNFVIIGPGLHIRPSRSQVVWPRSWVLAIGSPKSWWERLMAWVNK